jgi:hypothetical protein
MRNARLGLSIMGTGTFLLLFVAGAASVAAWVHVRWPGVAPRSVQAVGAHLLASLTTCTLVVPACSGVLLRLGTIGRLALVMAVAFPALAYGCLASIWLLRLLAGALGRSPR